MTNNHCDIKVSSLDGLFDETIANFQSLNFQVKVKKDRGDQRRLQIETENGFFEVILRKTAWSGEDAPAYKDEWVRSFLSYYI